MTDTYILTHALPGKRPGRTGRRIRIIAGLQWLDLPSGAAARTRLPSATGQWLRLASTAGAATRRTGFTREGGHLWSLAVLVMPALHGNGYAFIRNGSNISFVACVRDMPALVGDITGTPETVERACNTFLKLHERDTPPAGWTVVGSADDPVDITSVLPDRLPRQARLKPVNHGTRLTMLGLLLSALGGAALWGYHYYGEQAAAQRDAALALQASLATQESVPDRRRETPPWPVMPSVNTFLETCLPLMRGLPVRLEGWSLTAAECRADDLKTEYTRSPDSGATLDAFLGAVKKRLPDVSQVILDSSGDKIQLQQPLSMSPGGDDTLVHEERHLARFLLPFQRHNRPVSLEKQEDAERLIDIDGEPVTFFRDWYEWTFTLSERRAPDAVVFSWPGTRLTALTVTLSDEDELTWVTEGRTWALKTEREPDASDNTPPAE